MFGLYSKYKKPMGKKLIRYRHDIYFENIILAGGSKMDRREWGARVRAESPIKKLLQYPWEQWWSWRKVDGPEIWFGVGVNRHADGLHGVVGEREEN